MSPAATDRMSTTVAVSSSMVRNSSIVRCRSLAYLAPDVMIDRLQVAQTPGVSVRDTGTCGRMRDLDGDMVRVARRERVRLLVLVDMATPIMSLLTHDRSYCLIYLPHSGIWHLSRASRRVDGTRLVSRAPHQH